MAGQRLLGILAACTVALASAVLGGPAAHAATPPTILEYGFADLGPVGTTVPAGASVADPIGARAGVVVGSGATVVAGPAGGDDRAVRLPGGAGNSSNAYLRIPPGLIAQPGDVTVSAWVKWAGGQTCAWPFTLGSSNSNYLFFTPSCGGNLMGAVRAGTETRATGSGPLTTDWVHIAVALKSGQSVSTFVNGQQVATAATAVTGAAAVGTSTFSGYLGRSFFSADPLFSGSIDDVRVFGSALTATEVAEVGNPTYGAIARADAAAGLDLGDTSAVRSSLTLPTRAAGGSTVTWATSDPAVLSSTGAVTRPAVGQPDATVTLTPTYSFAGVTAGGDPVQVTVLAQTESELRELLAAQYVLEPVLAAGGRLPDLPGGVTAVYSSSDSAVTISPEGVLGTTADAATQTSISAELTVGATRLTKTFDVTVLPADDAHRLLGYQRAPLAAMVYDTDLAYSLHLGLAGPGQGFRPLHDNTGVLFAEGIQTADHFHSTTTFRSPWIFHRSEGGYGVVGVLADAAGNPLASHAGRLVYFETDDLLQFEQVGYLTVDSAAARTPRVVWDSSAGRYLLSWTTATGAWRTATAASLRDVAAGTESVVPGNPVAPLPVTAPTTDIAGAQPGNAIAVDAATARALDIRYGRISNDSIDLPAEVSTPAGTPLDLDELQATLGYTDGSEVEYPVVWNEAERAAVDFDTPGSYTVTGTLRDQRNIFPLAAQRADPTIIHWQGRYVMVSTWDVNNTASAGLPLRVADTVEGLATAPEVRIITNTQTATDGTRMVGCFWAPDIMEVRGQLQIFVAPCYGTASWSTVASTVIKLQPGGDPANPAHWSQAQKVVKADGSPLQLSPTHPGISLDMTYFQDPETLKEYAVWSERYINRPHPGGTGTGNGDAELWIAEYDPVAVRLTSDPVLLNAATASWEQNNTDVVEAPFFTVKDGTIWMTYSASMVDATYAVGLMQAEVGADLLDLDSWTEWNAPVVKSDPSRSEYGPGHSAFYTDEHGDLYFVYHAKSSTGGTRDAGIRKVFWASDGQPILDMTDDERIRPEFRDVTVTIVVEPVAPQLAVSAEALVRCVAGKATLVVRTGNDSDHVLDLIITTAFGTKRVEDVAPGGTVSSAFSTRLGQLPAGSVTVAASAVVDGEPVSAEVDVEHPGSPQCR